MAIVNITVDFNDDGTATVRTPEGKVLRVDSAKIAELTLKLAQGMGPIIERHKPHTHVHLDDDNHEHTHEHA